MNKYKVSYYQDNEKIDFGNRNGDDKESCAYTENNKQPLLNPKPLDLDTNMRARCCSLRKLS